MCRDHDRADGGNDDGRRDDDRENLVRLRPFDDLRAEGFDLLPDLRAESFDFAEKFFHRRISLLLFSHPRSGAVTDKYNILIRFFQDIFSFFRIKTEKKRKDAEEGVLFRARLPEGGRLTDR